MFHTPNMALIAWDLPTDPYDHTQLTDNWLLLDEHRHVTAEGGGRCIPTDGICDYAVTNIKLADSAVDTRVLADNAVTTPKIKDYNVTYPKLDPPLLFPLGGIIPWWRPNDSIPVPTDWVICMGQTLLPGQHGFGNYEPALANQSITIPDLRNRFIMGAGSVETGKVSYRNTIMAESGLVSYWRLDDANNNVQAVPPPSPPGSAFPDHVSLPVAVDQKGVNPGYYYHSPTVVPGALATDSNGATSFNGQDQYVGMSNPVHDDFSLEIWFKNSVGGYNHGDQWWTGAGIFDGDVPGFLNDFGVSMNQPGQIMFGIGNPDTTLFTPGSYADGTWHHLVVTRVRSNGRITIYIDGQQVAQMNAPNTGSLNASSWLRLAGINHDIGYFKGQLDEAAVYSIALSPVQVNTHYKAGRADPTTVPGLGDTGGSNVLNLAHSHIVNPHTHWNTHNHGILDDGYHAHYYINDDGDRVSTDTHFNSFEPGYFRFSALYVPGVVRGFGCVVGTPMTFEGTHSHCGFTMNTTITTSAESPGTNVALSSNTDNRPSFVGLLYIMKINWP